MDGIAPGRAWCRQGFGRIIPVAVTRLIRKSACALLSLLAPVALAQDSGLDLDVGGLLFGDLYHLPSHHIDTASDATGAVLRRAYLTLDGSLGDAWTGRLRFELNQSGAFETYRFTSDVKDLYLGRRLGRHSLVAGLAPTITYDLIESAWGLRYLARTPLDLHGVPSRDTGVSLRGPLNAAGTLSYRVMAGLGVEFGADSNDQDKWMGALTWRPDDHWTLDLYLDFAQFSGSDDWVTRQVFVGYHSEGLRWGLQYSNQDRDDDPPLELASVFAVKQLSEGVSLIGRIDRLFEPSPKGDGISYLPMDPRARATQFFGGVEFRLHPRAALTPNLVSTRYDRTAAGVRPENDLHLRLTLFLDFE
jgi:hypothetical protein